MFKNFILVFAFLLFNASCNSQTKDGIKVVNATEFKSLTKDNVQLVDVRTEEEFAEGHLKNAVNYDVKEADFKEQVEKLDKNEPVYIYCRSGGRSAKAAAILSEMGFKNVYDLDGGITSWTDNKNEIVK